MWHKDYNWIKYWNEFLYEHTIRRYLMSDSSIDIEDFYMNYNNAIMNSYEMDAIQKHYDCGLYLIAMEYYFELFLNQIVS